MQQKFWLIARIDSEYGSEGLCGPFLIANTVKKF